MGYEKHDYSAFIVDVATKHAAGFPDAPPLPKPKYSLTPEQISEVALELERVAARHGMPDSAGPLTRDEVLRFLANASALLIVLDRANPT